MTKKDYELIAKTIVFSVRAGNFNTVTMNVLVNEFGFALKQENPRFDIEKFHTYIEKKMQEWKEEVEADQYA